MTGTLVDDGARSADEVDDVSVHTPDLDDVFFALTGRPTTQTTPEMENIR